MFENVSILVEGNFHPARFHQHDEHSGYIEGKDEVLTALFQRCPKNLPFYKDNKMVGILSRVSLPILIRRENDYILQLEYHRFTINPDLETIHD